jgi:pimeloyl-ACP methyl ester carboxylesterase
MLISTPLFDIGNLERRIPKRQSPNRKRPIDDPDKTIMSSSLEATIPSASMMKQAMMERERAANRNRARLLRRDDDNPTDESMERNLLEQSIGKINLGLMLDRCFKRTEIEYDKLAEDVEGTDDRVLYKSVYEYQAPKMLDTINQLEMPTLLVHGTDDPLIAYPPEPVWDYVTRGEDGESNILYLPLEGVRHFPMLENERFGRFVLDFLETRDLSSLEGIKGRWRRRSR